MTFTEAWEGAKRSSCSLSKVMNDQVIDSNKYQHKTYSRGSFYYQGRMYHTDNGSLIPKGDYVSDEMIRMAEVLDIK